MRTEVKAQHLRRRRRQRGAAMVEAVIVIPVLILIWASLYYAGGLALSQQRAEMTARSCAWRYSASNCQVMPPECAAYLSNSTASSVPPDLSDTLKDGAQTAINGGDAQGIVETIVSELVAAPLAAAFTSGVNANVSQTVKKPLAYGGGLQTVTGRYHLACNIAPETPESMVEHAWTSLVE